MAAKHVYLQGFLLLLFNFVSSAASERRFSDFKRCADEECSMLLCRGKALKDFSGPDCRFLSFKESETIYVYYKLSGRRADIWAGSVGSHFGYFPKDLLAVNHIYTEKEFEVPAEETDFVCFDTGFDKFTNYDIDLLLGSSAEEIDNENKEASDQVQAAEEIQKVTEPLVEEEAENEKQIEHHDNLKDLHKAPDDQSASSADLDKSAEQSSVKAVALNTAGAPDAMERAAEADEVKQKHSPESVLEDLSDKSETKDTPAKSEMESVPEGDFISDSEPVTASEGAQIPDLKTTISSTFDAVVTSDEVTKKVTPYEEEDSEDVQDHLENDTDVKEEIPLLSYSEKPMNTPASDSLKKPDSPPATGEDKPKSAEENNTRASLGDALFSAVTGGETTPQDLNSEEKKGDGKQVQIPKLKTTLGTMFDAVITNEEVTKKVTPYEEEDSEDVEENPEIDTDITEEIPLLSYSEEPLNTPESDSLKKPETPPAREKDKPKTAEKNMWTSIGDAVFSAVTGGETTPQDLNSEEKKDDGKQMQIPKLKTTLGTTFDAVITNEDITKKVTPYEEEGSEDVDDHPEIDTDVTEETPLLSFTGEPLNTPESDSLKKPETPPATEDKPKTAEKNMWTSIGDAVFSAVTGVDIKPKDLNSEEDEDDEDQEEEDAVKTHDDIKEEPHPVESPKDLENIVPVLHDRHNSTSVSSDIKEHFSDSEKLLFDDDESDGEVIRPEETLDETVKPAEEQVEHQTEETMTSVDPLSQDDLVKREAEQLHTKPTYKPTEDKDEQEVSKDSEITEDEATIPDSIVASEQDLDNALDENKKVTDKKLAFTKTENYLDLSTEDGQSNELDVKDEENDHLMKENNNSQAELSLEEPEMHEEPHTEEKEDENDADMEEEKEELLEDENALLFSQSDKPSPETSPPTTLPPEPQYSDSIMRLTLLRDHFTEEKMEQFQKLLGLKNLFKVEAMFSDLDAEFEATRQSHADTMQDIENALEGILEASENTILDEIEKMLDSRDTNLDSDPHMDTSSLDEESEILDDFQELAFSLRQKYSTASDSTPLMPEKPSDIEQDEHELNVKEDVPHIVEEKFDNIPETEGDDNLTVTDPEEKPAEVQEEQMALDDESSGPDVSVEEDGGHFNKNKDHPPSFSTSDEMQKLPQDTLENPLDMGLGVEVEQSPSESVDSMEPVSERHEEEVGWFSTGMVYAGCILSMITNKTAEWTSVMISLLPEEWKPGETLFGCPWEAVVITALVGVVTFTLFFWRTVLAVKKREYLVDEQKLVEQIQAHKKEKEAALAKMAELQKQTEQLKENQKQSKETVSCAVKRMQDLENKVLEAETLNKQIAEEKDKYSQLLEEERTNALQNETRIEKLEKLNEKLQVSRKKVQEALAKTTVLLDEAKLREDARNVQQKCQQKEFATLKEENKTLKASIKSWEDKHKELNEKIKVYQKSQKELEDSVVLKDHNVEVLSELLADLDACDLQKSDTKVLANGEVAPTSLTDKKTAIKNRIKQMVDVSRVQTTLTVVEEERDRFMTKLLNEEKSRKALEEQHQELEHAIATLKSEKSHVENQFKILQQKNEIMVEMYQQKENALQQRLTKEELERRSKENLLSEVGGKALEAEEQVKILRQRINEMEEQMKKTEEVYKEQIKEQENKTHSNWVNARNAERALNQEKLESSKLREKLALLTSQLNERRAPLFRPNSGQPAGPRQGDSYGPSPVSGGAPSPPIMIEGPRRPPSAPIGRRIDPYGPRPPSDPHGRYAENKHVSGMDMMGPRSSSPANLDGSTQAIDPQIKTETQAEASTESPEAGPGSFLTSPIRDSPAPIVHGLQPGSGPHDPMLPPGPTGRLPPPLPYRPGLYALPPGPPPPNVFPPLHGPPLPANGHPGMPLPGPMGGEFGPRPTNGLAMPPRPGPGPVIDPRGPPPPHFRPPPPHPYGPMPPPQGARGPMGPRPPVPPDMRFPGPRDHPGQPMDLPLGVPPHPAHPGDAYGQPAPDALQNSVGAHSGPRQDLHVKQEAPQDSARPAMVKP